ncbi:MAG: hypothetical protein M3Y37_09440 [Chloroflexota bacterium]|nr:hypothetical protein [Chloroflexota bacterium]
MKPATRSQASNGQQAEGSGGKQGSGSKRFVFTNWPDSLDHELCVHAWFDPPERAPYLGRTGLAVPALRAVTRTETAVLHCNGLHHGPCAWPYTVDTD